MKDFKRIFFFLILICFYSCAEFQYASESNNACLKEIIGKWEVVDSYNSLNIKIRPGKISEPKPEPKPEEQIWIFTEDGILYTGTTSDQYEIQNYCRELIIKTEKHTFSLKIKLENGNMSLTAYESGTTLKKIN